jgi:TolB protein
VRGAGRLLALVTALLLGACGGSGDDPEPDLVFVSTRDGDYAVFGMTADGGAERRLTETDVDASSPRGLFFQTDPAWSPDGRTIAFASRRGGTFDLYAMNADGTGTRRLTATRDDDGDPTWSPDGRRIAFARGTPARLFVVDGDGSNARRVTDGESEEADPAWSPDGRWLAYSRREPGSSIRELWLVRPDGSQRRRLTSLAGVAEAPAWSPDGRRLAFSAMVDDARFGVYTVRVDGEDVRHLTSDEDSFEPAWSPDGGTIAFSRQGAIVAIDARTGAERTLTEGENNDSSPAWRPRARAAAP